MLSSRSRSAMVPPAPSPALRAPSPRGAREIAVASLMFLEDCTRTGPCNLRYLRAIFEGTVRFAVQPSNEPRGSSCNLRPARGRPWRNCLGRVVPGTHLDGIAGLVGSIARQEWLRNGCFELQSQKLSRAWHRFSVYAISKRSALIDVYPT